MRARHQLPRHGLVHVRVGQVAARRPVAHARRRAGAAAPERGFAPEWRGAGAGQGEGHVARWTDEVGAPVAAGKALADDVVGEAEVREALGAAEVGGAAAEEGRWGLGGCRGRRGGGCECGGRGCGAGTTTAEGKGWKEVGGEWVS